MGNPAITTQRPEIGSVLTRTLDVDWEPDDTPGFFYKTLLEDPTNKLRTVLMKVDPNFDSAPPRT